VGLAGGHAGQWSGRHVLASSPPDNKSQAARTRLGIDDANRDRLFTPIGRSGQPE
jgi:hypothetical protein